MPQIPMVVTEPFGGADNLFIVANSDISVKAQSGGARLRRKVLMALLL